MVDKPVDLHQKIDYLHDKIDDLNTRLKASGNFEMKMKFIDFIDNSIQRITYVEGRKAKDK